jgi:hypothetical protein
MLASLLLTKSSARTQDRQRMYGWRQGARGCGRVPRREACCAGCTRHGPPPGAPPALPSGLLLLPPARARHTARPRRSSHDSAERPHAAVRQRPRQGLQRAR